MKLFAKSVLAFLFVTHAAFASIEDFDDLFARANGDRATYSASQIQAQNQALFQDLSGTPYNNIFPDFAKWVSREEAEAILKAVTNHPIAGLHNLDLYDPKGNIGFCFGRAMTVHLEAIYSGVSKESIRKLWAFGDLRTGQSMWRYHVTAILRGPGKTWWAIDPVMGKVMTAEEWYQSMRAFDFDGGMKLYHTAAFKFGPSTGKYYNWDLLHPDYNRYFADLMDYYKQNDYRPVSGLTLRGVKRK